MGTGGPAEGLSPPPAREGRSTGGPAPAGDSPREWLDLALEVGGLGRWTWDRETQEVWWDDRLLELTARSRESAPGTVAAWLDAVHPGDRDRVAATLDETARSPGIVRTDLRLVCPDGRVRWFHCSGRAHLEGGAPAGAVGVMADTTGLHDTEARNRALLRRVQLTADLSMTLSASLDVDVILRRLAERLVPDLGDVCVVDLREGLGARSVIAVAARSPGPQRVMEEVEARFPRRRNPASSLARTLASGSPTLVEVCDDDYLASVAPDAEVAGLYRQLQLRSLLVAPLIARGQVLGAITLARVAPYDDDPYGPDDVDVALEITRRAALAVDNARLYTGEHAAAEALQRALLPAIEAPPGIAVAARYLPASAGVGGDWYDLFELPGGATSITIGDVVGHDLRAAASMGQLRSVIRSYASEGADPAEVLDRADRLVQSFSMAQLATAFYARLRPPSPGDGPGGWLLSYANAGHPPPILSRPDGSLSFFEGATGPPIGAPDGGGRRPHATLVVPPGSTVVCYTDGLVERRERDLEIGLGRLAELVRSGAWRSAGDHAAARLEALCELLTGQLLEPDRSDDVAVLALTLG